MFNPVEFCNIVEEIVKKNYLETEINKIPMVDGGEWSTEVLVEQLGYQKITVKDVVDPRGIKKDADYVKLDDDSAFIACSSILWLRNEFSEFKNPLNLTTYGYGQLIKHAIDSGFKKIYLGMGGTTGNRETNAYLNSLSSISSINRSRDTG